MREKRPSILYPPVKVLFALLIFALFFFAPVAYPMKEGTNKESIPALHPFASSAEACPWNCIKCTSWDPNAWPKTCLTYECVDAGGNCGEDDGGGGGPSYQPPTISHTLTCAQSGQNGWCIGALSLDLTASDPQGQSVIISGDVNGTAFACPSGQTTCSIPLPEGTGTVNYKVDSATGLSASGSTSYQMDATTPQISGSINGSSGQNGWYVTQTVVSASAFDSLSGLVLLEVSMDGSPYNNYQSPIVLMDGIHTIQFRAYDNAGNLTETPVQPVLVDTLPPTLNAPGSVRLVDTLNYQLADATSGLSQLTVSIADKDHLQPDVLSNFAVTGNAQDGSFSWDGMLPTSHANAGWYPFTLTVTDMAGHQASLSGAYEVKWRYLVALGLVPDKSEQKQNTSSSPVYAPGFASIPSSNTEAPIETALPTESSVEEEIQSASPPPVVTSQKPFQGASVQASFTSGNQSTASQSTNAPSNVLWGAAAAAVLGATLAEWQKKREEEEAARLAAMRNRGGGDEDEAPSKKKSPGRIAYEKMMQQKRIVGALQAEQNAKAAQAQTAKIAKATQADMTESEKLAVYKQTAGYIARQESLKEYERQKALEAQRAGERNAVSIAEAYKAQEQAKQNAVGGKPLAAPVAVF